MSPSATTTQLPLLAATDGSRPPADAATAGSRGTAAGALGADVARALRNAAALGLSLCGTWAVALAVRLLLPRHLGPELFGAYQFADSFTTVAFVLTSLGVDTYIRKEVATRPEHASDFFGGTTLVRLLVGALVMVVALLCLRGAGRTDTVVALVAVLGAAQLLQNANASFAALLHAVGAVNGLSVLNVACKLGWGAAVTAGVALGRGDVRWIGAGVLASEVVRATGMALLARRHAGLRWRVNFAETRAVLRASTPFYVGFVATSVYGGIDTSIMAFLARNEEVGWYGATSTLVGLSLVLAPLIGWVLTPLLSRAGARSDDELFLVSRRALQLILTVAFPITLLLGLHADLAVHTAFGDAFAPAARSLRVEAPMFVLTYAAMVAATVLVRLERGWALTGVSVAGMLVSPALNVVLVPWALARYGPGGAGVGAAITLMVAEFLTTAALFSLLGRRAWDRPLVVMLARTIGVCAAVAATHQVLAAAGPLAADGWGFAWARLAVEAALYAALALATGAADVSALRRLLDERRAAASPHPSVPDALAGAAA